MLKLGENLRKYRAKRELTQEQLADILGVSAQAVSRWENGTTYPDITLLPTIASYFEITLDNLMGLDNSRKEEKIKEILKENRILHNNGETRRSIELLRKALIDFPTESRLLYCLAQSIYSLHFQSGEILPQEERKNAVEETVQLLNKALRYADERFDDGGGCRQLLVFTYIKMGEYEKAKEAAMSAPLLPGCREMLLPQTLQGQEAIEEYQKNILHFTTGLYHNISDLRTRGDYSDKQKLEISLMAEQMLLLIGGDNSGFVELFSNTLQILKIHVKTNNKESTIKYLEKALQYAENCEKRPDRTKYDVPWICYCENNREYRMKHSSKSLYDDLLDFITKHDLNDLLGDNTRFQTILTKLQAH